MDFVAVVSWLRIEQPPATNASAVKYKKLQIRIPNSEIRSAKLAALSAEFEITV